MPLSDPEFVAEYQITTSNFGAEYGRNSGSGINILTKLGTNSLHGSLYGSEGNWRLDTLSTNQKAFEGLTQVPANNDTFLGATIGGPAIDDRLFFFGGLDSEMATSLPFRYRSEDPYPGGHRYFGCVLSAKHGGRSTSKIWPLECEGGNPSLQGPVSAVTYQGCSGSYLAGVQRTWPADSRQHSFIIKSDYQTEKNRFYGRYIYHQANFLNSRGNPAAGYPFDSPSLSEDYGFSWTRFASSSIANEFRGSYGRLITQDGGNSLGNTVPLLGDGRTPWRPALQAIPIFSVSACNPICPKVGSSTRMKPCRNNWTYLLGRNSLKGCANLISQRLGNYFSLASTAHFASTTMAPSPQTYPTEFRSRPATPTSIFVSTIPFFTLPMTFDWRTISPSIWE